MDKLRREMQARLKALPTEEVATRSARATKRLAQWLVRKAPPSGLVGLYRPPVGNLWGEVDLENLSARSEFAEMHFAFPRILNRFNREMDFAVPVHASDWVKGVYGSPEPRPELPAVDASEFDVIVVPGLVFGLLGERIGRGGGFYDRFLREAGGAFRVGLAFDFQVGPDPVPQEDWDARMDAVITDQRTIETAARLPV